MSSYQQFAELTMTDSDAGRGFSNPSYDVSHQEKEKPSEESRNGVHNGKQLSRSNSIGADPDHIEVNTMAIVVIEFELLNSWISFNVLKIFY